MLVIVGACLLTLAGTLQHNFITEICEQINLPSDNGKA